MIETLCFLLADVYENIMGSFRQCHSTYMTQSVCVYFSSRFHVLPLLESIPPCGELSFPEIGFRYYFVFQYGRMPHLCRKKIFS